MRRGLMLVVSALLVGLVGTAHAATLKPGAVREEIGRQLTATYPGLTFGNVACPDGVARKQDVTFTCTVQLPGTFLLVNATQTDRRGTVTFETNEAVVAKLSLEAFVAANASLPATVTCGATPWLVVRAGQQVTCHASIADGSQHDVHVTIRDAAGNATITAVT
jgi:hypothetical protein